MRKLDIAKKENKCLVEAVLKKIKTICNKAEKIISLYTNTDGDILANVDCGSNPRYFFHLWLDENESIRFVNKYLWAQFTPISDDFGRIDCEFRFPICGKTNNGCYLYNIRAKKDMLYLTSLSDFAKNENTDELEAEATITIKGDFYIAFKINSSGKIVGLIASNVNGILVDPNEEGFDLNKHIENLKQEVTKILNIERESSLEPRSYIHKPNVSEGEIK